VKRFVGLLSVAGAVLLAFAGAVVSTAEFTLGPAMIGGVLTTELLIKGLFAGAVVLGLWGVHLLVLEFLLRTASKRRAHDIRNVLRLVFGAAGIIALLGVLTDQ